MEAIVIDVPRLDEIARLVGDASRAAMLSALMDGRAWTGRELALFVHVSPSTASSHLKQLVKGHLLTLAVQGRHHYYRIASPQVAQALESLMFLAPQPRARHASGREIAADLRTARTCYDHLAGRLGVALADALVAGGFVTLSDGLGTLTARGIPLFEKLGLRFKGERVRRPLCRPCLDWSERRPHIAGRAGALIARVAFDRGWVQRKNRSRAVEVTERGVTALHELFGINWAQTNRKV